MHPVYKASIVKNKCCWLTARYRIKLANVPNSSSIETHALQNPLWHTLWSGYVKHGDLDRRTVSVVCPSTVSRVIQFPSFLASFSDWKYPRARLRTGPVYIRTRLFWVLSTKKRRIRCGTCAIRPARPFRFGRQFAVVLTSTNFGGKTCLMQLTIMAICNKLAVKLLTTFIFSALLSST